MQLTSLGGSYADVGDAAIDALRAQLKGSILFAGDDGFEESRTVWNAMIDRTPAFVVRCADADDVAAGVAFAREHELLLSVKGGGHNIAGLAVAEGAVMLDLSPMRGVQVDVGSRVAHAQGGCLLSDLDGETQAHGLATALGFVSATGVGGLTLGGGFGYLSRRWGWTTDSVVGMDVVTAEGRRVRATATENPDLFWGLRGGGGNFGVVTNFDFALHPLGPEIMGGPVAWPASEAPRVLELYRTLAEEAPRELTLVSFMRLAPPAPWLTPEIHGKPIVAIIACHSGSPEEAERAVEPIKSFGNPVGDALVRRPYTQLQSMLDATQPKGRRYYWKSEYLPGIEPDLCERFIGHAGRIQSPFSTMILFQIAGALNDLDEDYSAAGNRDARFVLNIGGAWEGADNDAANVGWARQTWEGLRSFSTGGTYVNFLTEDESPERVRTSMGSNIGRLAKVKARWDPDNFFRTNRNVAPG